MMHIWPRSRKTGSTGLVGDMAPEAGRSALAAIVLLMSLPVTGVLADNGLGGALSLHGYLQSYSGNTFRENALAGGIDVSRSVSDTWEIGAGYNYTWLGLSSGASLSEHILNGRLSHDFYTDRIAGKWTLQLQAYAGQSTLTWRTGTPVSIGGGHGMHSVVGASRQSETADIYAMQPQLAFLNADRDFYADLGLAVSEYSGSIDTTVVQFTPTIGLGVRQGYDWFRLRAYLIEVDSNDVSSSFSEDPYQALQLSYTHWFRDSPVPYLEHVQASVLTGERVLAVDSDASVVYSFADRQEDSLALSARWKLAGSSSVELLAAYSEYVEEATADGYSGQMLYLNLRNQW